MRSMVEARFQIESALVDRGAPSVDVVNATLCENGDSVLFVAHLADDSEPISALLHLPKPMKETEFNAIEYIEAFWNAEPRSTTRH